MPQKWYKRIIYLHLTHRCTVGRSWLRTPPAVLGSSELRSSEFRSSELRNSEQKVASPCQRLTFVLAHTPECTPTSFCCDGVKHAQHLYSNTPMLTLRLRQCNCPAPPRLHSFTSGLRPPWPPSTARSHCQELASAAKMV